MKTINSRSWRKCSGRPCWSRATPRCTRRSSTWSERRSSQVLRLLLLAASLAVMASGQPLRIYSEFQRIDPSGNVVTADRGSPDREVGPREILSPALVRNGYTLFHIAISPPRDRDYYLFVVQNPEDALQLKLYKESYAKRAGAWIP